jgi:very-short-patch-repair endonuclease
MDFKLDYMARLFRSIRNKRFESYAIQRIWHQLDDDRVQFVTQQYFKRKDGGYALADLYLPQINMVVEIDEGQHTDPGNEILDAIRSQQIQSVNNAEIQRIPICIDREKDEWHTMAEVNNRISEVVALIKQRIEEKGDNFSPWSGDDMLSPEYHIKKGYLAVSDNDYVRNIDDAATIFSTKAIHKGFLRAGGFDVPRKSGWIVWLPSVNNKRWNNSLSDDGLTIREYPSDAKKRSDHVKGTITKNETRITFFREKDALGFNFYKFVGVFKINKELSQKENKSVWECCADRYEL